VIARAMPREQSSRAPRGISSQSEFQNSKSAIGKAFQALENRVIACRRCPRLVSWRELSARNPPRRFAKETYWARPLPALGDPGARVLIVGLAPAAHGGNRTGRMFTGDESGRFLFRALHATGFANRPESLHPGDGFELQNALISAACRCAPPANRPTPQEFDNCRGYLEGEVALLPADTVFVALGALAFDACLRVLAQRGERIPRPRPRFAHGARYQIGEHALLATYHPSQQNTFTGKLTQSMLREVFRRARREVASR
jgi:uracil-DNA glycosylase family 4